MLLWSGFADCKAIRYVVCGTCMSSEVRRRKVVGRSTSGWLARQMERRLESDIPLADSLVEYSSSGVDWEGLTSLVETSGLFCREQALDVLRNAPERTVLGGKPVDSRKRQLMTLYGGRGLRCPLNSFRRYGAHGFGLFTTGRDCVTFRCGNAPKPLFVELLKL